MLATICEHLSLMLMWFFPKLLPQSRKHTSVYNILYVVALQFPFTKPEGVQMCSSVTLPLYTKQAS